MIRLFATNLFFLHKSERLKNKNIIKLKVAIAFTKSIDIDDITNLSQNTNYSSSILKYINDTGIIERNGK